MHKFSVAPMMDWTDRHCRYFHRLLSKETQLWSEMVTTKAILNGDKNRLLDFDAAEHPLVLQLGGSESDEMAQCAKIAQDWGYDDTAASLLTTVYENTDNAYQSNPSSVLLRIYA
jgi:tRNA-dihydrouridine synthase A